MSDAQKPRQAAASEMQQALDDLRLIVWRLQPLERGIGVPVAGADTRIPVNNNLAACRLPLSKAEILEIFKRVTDQLA